MKLRKLTYIFVLGAALGLTTACSDFLDTPTDTRVDLVNTDQLRMLMNSAYPTGNYAWPLELMSDNMEDNNSPDADNLRYNLAPYDRGDDEMFRWEQCLSETGEDSPSGIWKAFYNSVAAANAVLEKLDEWEAKNGKLDSTQKALRAEAKVLRAYDHFILAQVFCQPYRGSLNENYLGIPYVTKPEKTVKPHYERGTLAETYRLIEQDLTEGLADLDNGIYDVPKYHFNTAAANAFAARFYLYTRRYEKALEHANLAFGGAEVDPAPFLSDLWNNLSSLYYISDMGLYQNGVDKASNFMLYATYSIAFRHLASGCRYGVIRDALYSTIYGSSPAWENFKFRMTNGKGTVFTMHPAFNGSCVRNGKSDYGNVLCANVQEQFEYTDKVAGIGYAHVTRREFYGEETLLTRAEAKLFLGDKEGALKDLDTWEKARRSCPSAVGYEDEFNDFTFENIEKFYGGDPGYGIAKEIHIDRICPESDAKVSVDAIMPMLQCIQHVRRIETLHNGMRWFDIKRFGLEFARKIGKDGSDFLSVEDPRKAVQIPAEVVAAGMQANPMLDREQTRVIPSSAYERVK